METIHFGYIFLMSKQYWDIYRLSEDNSGIFSTKFTYQPTAAYKYFL